VIGSCLGLDFVTEGPSLILYGKNRQRKDSSGGGHRYRAIQNGFETLFTTAAGTHPRTSFERPASVENLQESLTTYTHPHVLRHPMRSDI